MPLLSSRRALHRPFFPLYSSSPPTQPPSVSPPISQSFPKYPSSSSSASTRSPFFPLYPSPPPPPTASIPTFPANLSSITSPSRNAPLSSKHIPIIALPVLGFILLFLTAVFFVVRRKQSTDKGGADPGSDISRLVPPEATSSSDTSKLAATPAPASTEFLYLGTLVKPGGHVGSSGDVGPAVAMESPELRPLPPLSRQNRQSFSSDEVFYSPKDVGGARKPKDGSHSPESTLSTPLSSPANFNLPPSPPPKKIFFLAKNDQKQPFFEIASSPPRRQAPPPPPPPPPPPVQNWAGEVSKILALQPPVLIPPKTTTAVVFSDGSKEDADEGGKFVKYRKPKLKPLHWEKVRTSSDRTMVWDHLKSSSFQLNVEMFETLFGCDSTNGIVNGRQKILSRLMQENAVLDMKKSQNIAILLRALNVTKEEVCEALSEGNTDSLGNELLETLLKMAPSKEEEIKLREYKDEFPYKLGPAEKFLKAMLDIPFAFKRVNAMLYIANFDSEADYLKRSFEILELACEELRNSRLFRKLLDAVLKTGNRMNIGTNRGDAQAFKLDTLLKLVDIRGTDGKTTLLHFVVQEISRTEGYRASANKQEKNVLRDDVDCRKLGLHVVSGLGSELNNVKKAATMDSEILSNYVSKLSVGIEKIREVMRLNETSQKFHGAMIVFLKKAEGEIAKLQSQENVVLLLVKNITEYFHGDLGKEEAHPFRIFMVVRDFIVILDHVCKDVGRANERSFMSFARQCSVSVSPRRSPVFPSDDESSSMSSSSS